MKVKDYEYNYAKEDYDISDEHKEYLLERLKECIVKDSIAHFEILKIGKNDEEYDFLYETLLDWGISIRGINVTMSGELKNFEHIPRMKQSYTPPMLDDEEQSKLFLELYNLNKKINNGDLSQVKKRDKVREKLIVGNMRYAKWIANSPYINRYHIPIEDKNQMAMIGLIRAVDGFDPTMGFKFSTYAYKTIQHEILRENGRTYHIASDTSNDKKIEGRKSKITVQKLTNMQSYIEKKNRIVEQFLISLNREPTKDEIMEILGISLSEIEDFEKIQNFLNPLSIDTDGRVVENHSFVDIELQKCLEEEDNKTHIKGGVYEEDEKEFLKAFRTRCISRRSIYG